MRRFPVRAFQASHSSIRQVDRRIRGALGLVRAVHSGAWLGSLSRDDLRDLDEATYAGAYGYHATDEHNLRGFFPWEEETLNQHFPTTGRILVTSAGGGREVVALLRRGLEVDAFECNEGLRSCANALLVREGLSAHVLAAPRDGWVDTGRLYDGIIVGWGSYTNIRGSHRRVDLLRGLRSLARSGAPLLASFFSRKGDGRAFHVAASVGNRVARVLGREPLEVGDVVDPTFQHYFSRDEAFGELQAGGFRPISWSEEGYTRAVAIADAAVTE